jgi:hypothetical protein
MRYKATHKFNLILLSSIVIILGIYFVSIDRSTLIPGHDNQFPIASAFKLIDPELYQKDIDLKYYNKFYPQSSIYLWSYFYRIFKDQKIATYAIYCIYGFIYISGIYFLAFQLFKDKEIALFAALFSISYRQVYSHVDLWGLFAIFDHPFARAIGESLIAWFLALFIKYRNKQKQLTLIFFISGLFTLVHNLATAHLFIILMMVMSYQIIIKERAFSTIVAPIIAFILGAIPALTNYLQASGMSNPDMNEMGIRVWYGGVPPLEEFLSVTFIDMSLPLILGILGYLLKNRNQQSKEDKTIFYVFISSILVGLSIFITAHIPKLVGLFVLRVAKYYYLIPVLYCSYYIVNSSRNSTNRSFKKYFLILLSVLMIAPSIYTIQLHRIGKDIYWHYIRGTEPPKRGVERYIRDEYRLKTKEDEKLFFDMCEWVKTQTPKSAFFLAPPYEFEFFKVHAQRGTVCSFKGLGCAPFSGESSKDLNPIFYEVDKLYRSPFCDEKAVIDIAHRTGADYFIIDKNRNENKDLWRLSYQPIFENNRFLIYKIQ